jgi:crossover junction endodeoxyribonuclease RuvC
MSKRYSPTPKVILGIDPGTTRIGYGLIQKSGRGKTQLIDYGVIEPGRGERYFKNLEKRLLSLIKKYQPELAAVEKIFFSKNKKTAIEVAEARGVVLFILNKNKVKTVEFTPNEIKSAVTGSGRSDKKTVAEYVCLRLGLKNIDGPDDAADALAIALRASFGQQ